MKKSLNDLTFMLLRIHTAYHEAGHAVAALALGMRVEEVWVNQQAIGCMEQNETHGLPPEEILRLERQGRPGWIECYRRLLCVRVAGAISNNLWEQLEGPTEQEAGSMETAHPLVSTRYTKGETAENEADDLFKATLFCVEILDNRSRESVLDEVLRAEAVACDILKKHWADVETIAKQLLTLKSGRLTHDRLMKLVGYNFSSGPASKSGSRRPSRGGSHD